MSEVEIGLIFSVLGLIVWLASTLCVAEAIPGSRRPVAPWALGVFGSSLLAAVFALLFHDYSTDQFVFQGMKCLIAGLVLALPASLGTWWLLRRGFSVNWASSAFARGALAGLAGVMMLELHCPNFETLHLMVWHIGVIPISGAIGVLVAWTTRARRP